MTKHPTDHRKLWLANMCNQHKFTIGLELGVQAGVTFSHMVETCPNLTWVGIDHWNWRPSDNDKYYKPLAEKFRGHERAVLVKGNHDKEHVNYADGYFDIIFIDGMHWYENVNRDIKNWFPKVRKGGIICGHDINQQDVERAVRENLQTYETGPDLIWWKWKE